MKDRRSTLAYPRELKNVARSIHFHSPAAYEIVRSSFMKCLPSAKTLNAWICSKQNRPGISEEMLNEISKIVNKEERKRKKLFFNITFDEMHIKQHKEWDSKNHSWKGLVDLGGQLNEINAKGSEKVATKALVFLLVCVNGGFKAPVAHYLINSLNGQEKFILLKDLLIKLNEKNIDVVSVTFDGDKAHKTAVEALGANLDFSNQDTFKTFFEHPITAQPVYVFYDPCHCLKLCRNYFALKGPLFYENEKIDWNFIKLLNEKQQNEALHCACKIRNRHVYFCNEKMKVFLAAQVLSNSTAIALQFLEFHLQDPLFTNASTTATFCKNMNDIFDLLNIRNKFCKTPGRSGISKNSLLELKNKIDYFISYIQKLEFFDKTSKTNLQGSKKFVTNHSSVCTGFVGFIISLQNIYNLASYLLNNNYIEYFLSYKISQDHIEMFFSLIRRMNGFNNNPTSTQYLSAYKKLLSNKLNLVMSSSANCTPQDGTLLLSTENHDMNTRNGDSIKKFFNRYFKCKL